MKRKTLTPTLSQGEREKNRHTPPLPEGEGGGEGYSRDPINRARQLRRGSTEVEKSLWRHLRNRKLRGYKFRRQHSVGPYTLDFLCPEANLAIELDGGGHADPGQIDRDRARDDYLSGQGIVVMRVWNNRFRENPEGVLSSIAERVEALIQQRAAPTPILFQGENEKLRSPHPNPLPQGEGGGNLPPLYQGARGRNLLPLPGGEGGGEGGTHLTYCLNIHRGESWDDQLAAIRTHACAVRDRVAGGRPFGLGLRLSAASAHALSEPRVLAAFRALLERERLYAFTINGFPYGAFHATRVKEAVYRPDWRAEERLAYTRRMADVLAALLPAGVEGSISTVPVGFGADFADAAARAQAADRLLAVARHLAELESRTGRLIHLGLEPEPACVLETCDEAIAFFALLHDRAGVDAALVRRHLGICFDTCHVALAFEDLAATWRRYRDAGIRISKVQLSAALEVRGAAPARLAAFVEPVYLHQVRMRRRDGAAAAWLDLPDALAAWPADADTARIHFHVPLFWPGDGALQPTTHTLDDHFRACLRDGSCGHREIETYTFDVLPPELRAGGVVDSICREFAWVRSHLD